MSLPPETELSTQMPWVEGATRVFGVIAHPVDHVRAPMVFNPRFAAAGLPHIMVPINAPPEKLESIISALRAMPNFGGLAVTIPHKMPLADLCDSLGTAAQLTGAVNAVRFDDDGTMHGDNFDGAGFVAGLIGNGYDVADKAVLLIGAGGSARAIAATLIESKIGKLTIANRSLGKAEELASLLAGKTGFASVYAAALADRDGGDADMIINCTSLGLKPGDALPLALDAVRPDTLIADIIMVPAETEWLFAAQKAGFRVHYGRHMLDYQIDLIGKFIGAL
jgi:shikimate dehydrogenase